MPRIKEAGRKGGKAKKVTSNFSEGRKSFSAAQKMNHKLYAQGKRGSGGEKLPF